MKTYLVYLSTYLTCLIRANNEEEAIALVTKGRQTWPKIMLGSSVRIFDEIPTKEELDREEA